MRSKRQLVATHGHGFGVFRRCLSLSDLRPVATGCNTGLHKGSWSSILTPAAKYPDAGLRDACDRRLNGE